MKNNLLKLFCILLATSLFSCEVEVPEPKIITEHDTITVVREIIKVKTDTLNLCQDATVAITNDFTKPVKEGEIINISTLAHGDFVRFDFYLNGTRVQSGTLAILEIATVGRTGELNVMLIGKTKDSCYAVSDTKKVLVKGDPCRAFTQNFIRSFDLKLEHAGSQIGDYYNRQHKYFSDYRLKFLFANSGTSTPNLSNLHLKTSLFEGQGGTTPGTIFAEVMLNGKTYLKDIPFKMYSTMQGVVIPIMAPDVKTGDLMTVSLYRDKVCPTKTVVLSADLVVSDVANQNAPSALYHKLVYGTLHEYPEDTRWKEEGPLQYTFDRIVKGDVERYMINGWDFGSEITYNASSSPSMKLVIIPIGANAVYIFDNTTYDPYTSQDAIEKAFPFKGIYTYEIKSVATNYSSRAGINNQIIFTQVGGTQKITWNRIKPL